MSQWTIFSNHGHVLVCLARDPNARLRDVAADVDLTERAVQKIVRDLQQGGMISVTRHGRRNSYRIESKTPLRHDLEAHCKIGALMDFIGTGSNSGAQSDMQAPAKMTFTESGPEPIAPAEPIVAEPNVNKPGASEPEVFEPDIIPPEIIESETTNSVVEDAVKPVLEEANPEPSATETKGTDERQQGSLF